jgi:tRNA1(Val) A37 N6-methylase TrmN6
MSSINPHYTFQYSQPEEYHFSHDSVFLARKVFERYAHENLNSLKALDLCAGSGVIGLDFIFHCQKEHTSVPAVFDFLEVQEIYKKHFQKNVETLNAPSTKISFLNLNYDNILHTNDFAKKYNLILSNPPYFLKTQGKMSPSDFKNRCRFFLDSDFKTMLEVIDSSLADDGEAYVLLRNLEDHGVSLFKQAQEILNGQRRLEIIDDIRGTDLVLIK